ncbi:MAG: hypothetical protein ABR540_20145, partial [Acidimicrobiales bacterium]
MLIALGVVGLLLATLGAPASAKNVDAQGLCERRNGSFIDLDGLAYVCLLPTAATKGEIRQAGRLCTERNGVLYVAVGNAAYACVLPGGGPLLNAYVEFGDDGGLVTGPDGLRLFPVIIGAGGGTTTTTLLGTTTTVAGSINCVVSAGVQ